ncbi:MAG: 2-hydroxyacyl-CoA dehydratase [Kiritimatiellae bacterium]|nr:2-hydroxyacyl-CoA dehydratase [Kiritimatiellia bacterium]
MSNKSHYLGIDIGSTTFKAVLMSGDGKVERTVYRRTQPVESGKVACTGHCSACGCCSGGSVKKLALEFLRAAGISFKDVDAIVVTGSQIVEDTRRFIPFDFQVSEVTAHVAGAKFLHPDVDAIIDCGGQDSKCMVYNPTMKLWTSMMSGVCAAGTGSFLDSVAQKLGVKVEDVADKVNYESNTEFSSVCAVLSATSINKFKNRVPIGDLLAGACKAQARTILNSVGQLLVNAPGRKILFQGGVAFNKAVAFFLKKLTGSEIVIPQYHEVMGALGAAVIAMRLHDLRENGKLDLAKVEYEPTRGKSTLLRIKSTKRDFFSHDPSKPLVWRNLFFPAEILNAMGCRIRTLETYAALFGRRADKVKEALGRAAQKGFDGQTCSFLRMLEGMELDKPDFVVSTVQPCQQAERVFADLVREHGIPDRLYSLQTPVNSQARNAVETVADGLAEAVSEMEKAFGRKLDPGRLEEACVLSNEAADLARKCADLRFTSPPLVRGSEAIYNAVVFSQLWGTQDLVDIQKAYYEELLAKKAWAEQRYSIDDTHRLLWLHLPPFYDTKHLDFIETTCNAPIVFEETNFVGWGPLDPKDPYRSLARKLLESGFLDPALRVEYVKRAVPAGRFNGVILYTHGFGRCSLADRALSKHLRETLDSIGVPLLALEGDCMDASIDPCSTTTKISSFVEALNLNRYGNIFGKVKE